MADQPILLAETDYGETISHVMSTDELWAIKAAIAANRPLLLEGEPGIGKTQLAYAAANMLKRPIVSITIDSRTESRDLMWHFDAIERLAEAQLTNADSNPEESRKRLHVSKFVRPGPIWWALNWQSAKQQLGDLNSPEPSPSEPDDWQETDGVVILVDEIDKADRDLPNGLLEAFGSRKFTPPGRSTPVEYAVGNKPPLMIVTTNRERTLPAAFLRRCLSLKIELPPVLDASWQEIEEEKNEFIPYLIERGKAHFSDATDQRLEKAARKIMEYRVEALKDHQTHKAGLAEYLDLLRTIHNLEEDADDAFDHVCKLFRKPIDRGNDR